MYKLATCLSILLLFVACGDGSDGTETNGGVGAAGSGETQNDGGPTGDSADESSGGSGAGRDDPDAMIMPPTPGGEGTLTVTDNYDQYLALKWEAASDGVTSPDELEYLLYYSPSANLDTVANVLANGTPVGDWTRGLTRKAVTEVAPGSTYHYNVLVRNVPGNEVAYAMKSATSGTTPFPIVDGTPSSMAVAGNNVYIAGHFAFAGPPVVGGVMLDSATGEVSPNTLPGGVAGRLDKVIPDGRGGWFIFGRFTHVHEMERYSAAHLAEDGVLYDWAPTIDGTVVDAVLSGSTVYIGGKFSSVSGMPRNNVAAIDVDTAAVLPWNPDVTSNSYQPVGAIAVNGSTVYIGGSFTAVGGQSRMNIAAIEMNTGTPTGWNPEVEGISGAAVKSIVATDTAVYIGGFFDSVAGQPLKSLAAISPTSGNPASWAPNPSGVVEALTLVDTTLFMGGNFSTVSGQPRSNLAAVSIETGQTTAWNPGVNGFVRDLAVNGSTVYIGGSFLSVGGQPRTDLAAVDSGTGHVMSWTPNLGRGVSTLAATDSRVYVGGTSTRNGQRRNSLTAINAQTGTVVAWDPGLDVTTSHSVRVGQLVTLNHNLYVGGEFQTAAGQARNCFAAFDTYNHSLTSWNPGEPGDGCPEAMAKDGTNVYVAGRFKKFSGHARHGIASFNAGTGQVTGWQPGLVGWGVSGVYVMETIGSNVYLGGHKVRVGLQGSSGILAVDKATGDIDTSFPEFEEGMVTSMAARGSVLYMVGYFTSVGGQARNGAVAIDTATKTVTSWNPNVEGGYCETVALSDSAVYLGGSFRTVGGQVRNRLAAVNAITGAPSDWDPDLNDLVTKILIDGPTVYIGGYFQRVGVKARANFAAIDATTGIAR